MCRFFEWRCFRLPFFFDFFFLAFFLVSGWMFPEAPRLTGAVDRGRRRRRAIGPVALVRRFAGQQFRFFREAAAGAGVVELHVFAVVVTVDQRLEGREVDVHTAVADRFEPDVGADGNEVENFRAAGEVLVGLARS